MSPYLLNTLQPNQRKVVEDTAAWLKSRHTGDWVGFVRKDPERTATLKLNSDKRPSLWVSETGESFQNLKQAWAYLNGYLNNNNQFTKLVHHPSNPKDDFGVWRMNVTILDEETVKFGDYTFKRVEEPEPKKPTLLDIVVEWNDDENQPPCKELVRRVEEWLPKSENSDNYTPEWDRAYNNGWNDCLKEIREDLQ